ncbi:serine-protein kinase ATM, partial [Nematocida minor]|uniref:serine-protein kinase ATM n=1 Tax=Nematocida minor TaxID=1912983 RepID=UPI00221EE1F4
RSELIDSLLLCVQHISAEYSDVILRIMEKAVEVDTITDAGAEAVRRTFINLFMKKKEGVLHSLVRILDKNGICNLHDVLLYGIHTEVKDINDLVRIFGAQMEKYQCTADGATEYRMYFVQLLFIAKEYSILSAEAESERNRLIEEIVKECRGENDQLTINTVDRIFQHKSTLCTISTLFYTRKLDAKNLDIEVQESIFSATALIYGKICYDLFLQAVEEKRETSSFYVHCALLQSPELILEIDNKFFEEENSTEITQYTCFLYSQYNPYWEKIKRRYRKCIEHNRENAISRNKKNEERKKKNRGRLDSICNACRVQRAAELCAEKIKSKSMLWMVAEGDAKSIRKYLDENARSPSSLAVFLEKIYPKINIEVKSMRLFDHLDGGECFRYPESIRLLPRLKYTEETVGKAKDVFSEAENEKRIIWLLFLESVIRDMYETEKVLTDDFHLQVLIRAPGITERICKSRSRRREERIVQLSIEILEGALQVTEQEERNVMHGLRMVEKSTEAETLSKDIECYLSKKRKSTDFEAFLKGINSPIKREKETPFTQCLSRAKEIIGIFYCTDVYNSALDAPFTPIELVRMKSVLFHEVVKLSLTEQKIVEEYFNHKDLSYEKHLRSNMLIMEEGGKVKKIVDAHYNEDLQEISTGIKIENECVYLVSALMHTIYPEKYFSFLLLTKAVAQKESLAPLEIYAINHAFEYLYAYDRELFRELRRLCAEKSKPAETKGAVNNRSMRQRDSSADDRKDKKISRENIMCSNSVDNSSDSQLAVPEICLKLKRHGALSKSKQRIILAKYQNEFFTRYYNCRNMEKVISEYFKGLLPIASLNMLVFVCDMPATTEDVLKRVPCTSSQEFLNIFYYADQNISPPLSYSYCQIAEMIKVDRKSMLQKDIVQAAQQKIDQSTDSQNKQSESAHSQNSTENSLYSEGINSTRNSGLSYRNDAIDMYNRREWDNGFITTPHASKDSSALPDVDKILKAASRLTKWTTSVDKSDEIDFLFSDSMLFNRSQKYVNFLQSKKVIERFRFIDSIKTGKTYTGSREIEEILYICTRKKDRIACALEKNRTLTKDGIYCTLTALEKKWLKMPAESFYMHNKNKTVVCEITKTDEIAIAATKEKRKREIAADLLLFKIEQGIHTLKNPFLLLADIERECTEQRDKKTKATESECEGIEVPRVQNSHKKCKYSLNTSLLSKITAAKINYILNEFENKPIDILNDHVKPASLIDFEENSLRVTETLAKTCLTIFNRHAMHSTNYPAISLQQKVKNKMLQKEEEAAMEMEECRARQYTKVEETARALGISLYIQLAERERKPQHIISLIHLLFSEHPAEEVLHDISLEGVPTKCFLPLKQQIISKFAHLHMHGKTNTHLYRHLSVLIQKFLVHFPFLVVYDLILREKKGADLVKIPSKIRMHAEAVIRQYKNIHTQVQTFSTVSAVFPPNIPVLSRTQKSEHTKCYIHKVLPEIKRLKGINKPVLISILSTDGAIYKEIIKKNDDLKQDILSMQVFSYMNTVLALSSHTQTIKERIVTYNIIALDKLFGIIEFVAAAEPLGNAIEDLHSLYYPSEITNKKCREIMQKYIDRPLEEKVKALKQVYTLYTPVLKRIFDGRGPFEYCKQRKTFTNSFAITSIATYILGLGDRHPHNILIDKRTKELVNIDLNLIFDQGKALTISEKVPFRMTRNIQQCIIATEEHSYERVMNSFLASLKESKENLLVFVNILQNEPLQRWRAIQKIAQIERMFSDYKSILSRLKDKLNGIEDGFVLSNSAHIQCLVQRAVDISNQASIYPGWSPWM